MLKKLLVSLAQSSKRHANNFHIHMTTYLAIDPGLRSGAWAAIDHNGTFLACGDVPSLGDRVQPRLLIQALREAIPPGDVAEIMIEQVGVMPKQGITSTGHFMRATGCIEAVASLMMCPVHFVTPQKWKKHHGLIGTTKADSLAMARAKWPEAPLRLAKHHGRGDALLMALYGMETLQ